MRSFRVFVPASTLALGLLAALPSPAYAQRVTGSVAGRVLRGGEPQVGAKVEATQIATGATVDVASTPAGTYTLANLTPGSYLIVVTLPDGEVGTEYIDVGVGQSVRFDLDLASATMKGAEKIEVSGKLTSTTTSEVATDVDREQIANLPQNNRNFLNFAQLAPGVRQSTDEFNQNVSSGGQEARQTNVFVDGLSLKNNVIEGGVVGQDASRGSPFPQLAIGGFRVLTQNFKAEYEQAGSSIISTVTRSGGNTPHVELYGSWQDRNVTAIDPFAKEAGLPKPRFLRYQAGGLASGPIIEDKLFALVTYEGNYQDRANQVTLGNPTEENLARFGRFEGNFTSPFREHLGFAKLSWLPARDHTVDLSSSVRLETDIRSFGGQTSFESGENVRNNVVTVGLRHQWRLSNELVNEANVQFLSSQFNPGAENPDVVGEDFGGVIRIGGRDTDQDVGQRTITFRDDVTLPTLEAAGEHHLKTGAKVSFQNYHVERTLFGNPVFRYRIDPAANLDFDAPFEAEFGFGDPRVTENNVQIGLYVQDDWQPIPRLEINAGVRWDIETNPVNNKFVTPDDVRAAVTELAATVAEMNGDDFFRVDNYLTDGSQRPIFLGAIQPRLGASYDLLGNQRTVLFGGVGRYYDRTLFNDAVDEKLRLQYEVRKFQFSEDGAPRNGEQTIVWDPSYLSREGLRGLIDSGVAPEPEIFLLENDTKPLHSDQISGGVRQQLGPFSTAVTFSHIRTSNGLGFYPANRQKFGNRDFIDVQGFGNVLISADDRTSKFTGVYITAEKPYTDASRWGVSATYTLGWSKLRGEKFNFNFPTIRDTPVTPGDGDERHRLVVGAIAGLPEDFKLSTFIQLGTGVPFNIQDESMGGGVNARPRRNAGRADGLIEFKQIDLRLTKQLKLGGAQRMTAFVECFNIFNWYNYGGYDGFIPPTAAEPNPRFGEPSRLVGITRSFQLGMTYGF